MSVIKIITNTLLALIIHSVKNIHLVKFYINNILNESRRGNLMKTLITVESAVYNASEL